MNEEYIAMFESAMKTIRDACSKLHRDKCSGCPLVRFCPLWDGADVPPYMWKVKE